MKIIIEGLDRCGKSTLIENIIKHYKKPFMKLHFYGPPFKDKSKDIQFDKELYGSLLNAFNLFDNVIADRSHLGALVYSPLYRGHDGSHVLDIGSDFPECTILITLIDNATNLLLRDDGLSFSTDLDKKNKEIQLFIDAHKTSSIKNKLIIDVSDKDIQEVFEISRNFIDSIEDEELFN